MTPQQILAIAKSTLDIGSVKHEEFVGYIIGIAQGGKENPYMSVDGRVMMACLDHIRQGKRLDYGDPVVRVDNEEQLTLQVTITSEIYGKRHGIATSKKNAATGRKETAEQASPWEVAETSAIGRALSQFGYGVFAGSGLPSANDMQRATATQAKPDDKPKASSEPKVEKKSESAANGNGESGPKPLPPTGRGGICAVHGEPTHEYKKANGTTFWGHRHDNEPCTSDPKPETILEIPGGVK